MPGIALAANSGGDVGTLVGVSGLVIGLGYILFKEVRTYFTDKKVEGLRKGQDELAGRVRHVEQEERKCQEDRKNLEKQLLKVFQENTFLKETLPREMVENVAKLVAATDVTNNHLAEQTRCLAKWDSDEIRKAGLVIESIKELAVAHGHRLENVEIVLDRMAKKKTHPPDETTKG